MSIPKLNFENKDVDVVGKAKDYTDKKYLHTQAVIYAVLIVVLLVFIQIVIDSFRFSSVTYKEYADRIEERSTLQRDHNILLEKILINQESLKNQISEKSNAKN